MEYFTELKIFFEKFPGIGPRQASRFIWALVDFSENDLEKFGKLIADLNKYLIRCSECFRISSVAVCSFCVLNSKRDHSKIMIVESDNDVINIEKAKIYSGLYHVLGGVYDALEENPVVRERIKALYGRVSKKAPKEIILALSPTKLGGFTAGYIEKILEPVQKIKITRLARGLSTGVELEYADEITLRQALDNRK